MKRSQKSSRTAIAMSLALVATAATPALAQDSPMQRMRAASQNIQATQDLLMTDLSTYGAASSSAKPTMPGTVVQAKGGGVGNGEDNAGYVIAQYCVTRLGRLKVEFDKYIQKFAAGRVTEATRDFNKGIREAMDDDATVNQGAHSAFHLALHTSQRAIEETDRLLAGYCTTTKETSDDDRGTKRIEITVLPLSYKKCVASQDNVWHHGLEDDSRSYAQVKRELIVSLMEQVILPAAQRDEKDTAPFYEKFPLGLCTHEHDCFDDLEKSYNELRHGFEDAYSLTAIDMIKWVQHLGMMDKTQGLIPEESYEMYLKLINVTAKQASTALGDSTFGESFGCPAYMLNDLVEQTKACPFTTVGTTIPQSDCVSYEYQRLAQIGVDSQNNPIVGEEHIAAGMAEALTGFNGRTANALWHSLAGEKDEKGEYHGGVIEQIEQSRWSRCGLEKKQK